MMYREAFYIAEPVSNNSFSHDVRMRKQLFVPALVEGGLDDVRIGSEIVFEDFDDEGVLRSCVGLKHFVRMRVGGGVKRGGVKGGRGVKGGGDVKMEPGSAAIEVGGAAMEAAGAPAYVFDNHNHAFAFWQMERLAGTLEDGALLIHVDQHKDTRIPASFLSAEEARDPEKIFEYTNTVLNVGNFIPAAQKTGLVGDIVFIDSEASIEEFDFARLEGRQIILDVDLDFFTPELDYIGNEKKVHLIQKILPQARVITFATSPFFIEQKLALAWLRRIFR